MGLVFTNIEIELDLNQNRSVATVKQTDPSKSTWKYQGKSDLNHYDSNHSGFKLLLQETQ